MIEVTPKPKENNPSTGEGYIIDLSYRLYAI